MSSSYVLEAPNLLRSLSNRQKPLSVLCVCSRDKGLFTVNTVALGVSLYSLEDGGRH